MTHAMRIETRERMFLQSKMQREREREFINHVNIKTSLVIYFDSACVVHMSLSPGLRGSHTLRTGSEPPAATSAEPSPPTSSELRAFPQNYIFTETNIKALSLSAATGVLCA